MNEGLWVGAINVESIDHLPVSLIETATFTENAEETNEKIDLSLQERLRKRQCAKSPSVTCVNNYES